MITRNVNCRHTAFNLISSSIPFSPSKNSMSLFTYLAGFEETLVLPKTNYSLSYFLLPSRSHCQSQALGWDCKRLWASQVASVVKNPPAFVHKHIMQLLTIYTVNWCIILGICLISEMCLEFIHSKCVWNPLYPYFKFLAFIVWA